MYALVTISPSDSTLTFSQFSFNYTVKLIHSVRDKIHEGLLNKSFKHVNKTENLHHSCTAENVVPTKSVKRKKNKVKRSLSRDE